LKTQSSKISADSNPDALYQFVEELCGSKVQEITSDGAGANSRILKVRCEEKTFALKFYREGKENPCDRLDAEAHLLQLCEKHGITSVPRLIAVDRMNNCSLLEWIDGVPIDTVGPNEIHEATDFIEQIYTLRKVEGAETFTFAIEACLSGAEIVSQLQMRLARLRTGADQHLGLKTFLENELAPVIEQVGNWSQSQYTAANLSFSKDLDRSFQTIGPTRTNFKN